MTTSVSTLKAFLSRRPIDVWPLPPTETLGLGIVVAFYLGVIVGWLGNGLTGRGGAL